MCWSLSVPSFFIFFYVVALYLFGIYLRFISFHDYFYCFACRELDYFEDQDYDYIVVGSGSAGSIVARRLAENVNLKILLLEAGSSGNSLLQIPAASLMLQDSVYDWQYQTVPQKQACLGLDKKVSRWPMGKIAGGTAMLNNMIYVRGHKEDFGRWFQDSCNYDYEVDILPYFEKLENFGTNKQKCSVTLSDLPFKSNVSDFFTQAGLCLGYDISDGVNAEPGFSVPKVMIQKGQRWTPFHQMMKQKKSNLRVFTNSHVEKVLLHNNVEAYGVKYTYLDEKYVAKASKGIILSAGVIGSPKILLQSGIGPKKHLQEVGIIPKIDLPVGENLQDHVTTGLDLLTMDYPANLGIEQMMSVFSIFNYFIRSKGPWTTSGCENIAFFNTPDKNIPELQFMIFPMGVTSDQGTYLRTLTGIGKKLWDNYFAKIDRPSFTILPVVLHPKSRGTVRLRTRNPNYPPMIDPNYLSDPYDLDILLQGIEMIKEFIATPPMRRLGVRLNTLKFPGCEEFDFDTKPYWECYVRQFTLTSYHPVGTCKMGEVVENDYQVKGTSKLYVVDGSVLPDLPSGNPNGAIMMMAERAAEIIRHHCWSSQRKCCAAELFEGECNC